MKKIYSTFFALLATGLTVAYGQSQRLVLVDHFTQASCGPCASQNPQLEATLQANSGSVIAVKHQVSWPGSDPMNAHYPAGPEDRRNFYGITGVPNTCLDGSGPGAPNTIVTSTTIGARAAVPSPFTVTPTFSVANGVISVDVDVTCTQAVSGDLKVFIAVVENEIIFSTPPGSNGETEFFNVLKQYIGGTSGNAVAASWAVNDNATVSGSWTHTNVYDENQLAVIAWVQDMTTKEIHQAGYAPPVAQHNLNAMAFAVDGVPTEVCDGSISPVVNIRNAGGTDLTSLTINYDVNGTAATPYTWTGNLPFLSNEDVTLPALAFSAQATNTLTITLSAPNGGTDEFAGDDVITASFDAANTGTQDVTLTIVPDNYGSEITWTVKNSGGTTLYSGGPYTDGQTTPEVINMTLGANDCYEYTQNDSYGDGICCAWGNGSYTLTSNGSTLLTGGEFSDEITRLFKVELAGIDEQTLVNNFDVYPNPTSDVANVVMNLNETAEVIVEVYTANGQKVHASNKGELVAGEHAFTVDFSNLEAGLYFVEVTAGNTKVSKRVTNMK